MKILVTGASGQLGQELRRVLEQRAPGITTYLYREDLDLTDREAVGRYMRQGDFTHVINCAAYTAVDRAEEEKLECHRVNIDAVSNLATFAEENNYKILHVSTDYVFDGTAHRPYNEGDKPAPLSVYGASKRKSETALLGLAPGSMVIRTGWLYSPYGKNFVKTVLRLARENRPLRIVADQIGTPTYAADLAAAIASIVFSAYWTPGIFHYSDEGVASWYDFAVAILEAAGFPDKAAAVTPIPTSDFPTAAARPFYSVLDKSRIKATFGIKIPHWHSSLLRCMERMENND